MGAWIEIAPAIFSHRLQSVAPLVGAWIEIPELLEKWESIEVAPLVGAWIEILTGVSINPAMDKVAPLVGAWIEIPPRTPFFRRRRRSPCGSVD